MKTASSGRFLSYFNQVLWQSSKSDLFQRETFSHRRQNVSTLYSFLSNAKGQDDVRLYSEKSQRDDNSRTEDAVFNLFKNQETNLLSIGKFLSALKTTGLRKSDPRLKEMMENLKQVQRRNAENSMDTQRLDLESFRREREYIDNLFSIKSSPVEDRKLLFTFIRKKSTPKITQ